MKKHQSIQIRGKTVAQKEKKEEGRFIKAGFAEGILFTQ